jgi:hypothetical protein
MPDALDSISFRLPRLVLDERVDGLPFVGPLSSAICSNDDSPIADSLGIRRRKNGPPQSGTCSVAVRSPLSILVKIINRSRVIGLEHEMFTLDKNGDFTRRRGGVQRPQRNFGHYANRPEG